MGIPWYQHDQTYYKQSTTPQAWFHKVCKLQLVRSHWAYIYQNYEILINSIPVL